MYWKKNKKIGMTLFTTAIILISIWSISTMTLADDPDSIIISEIMYNPEGTDGGREWIEIYNTYDVEINITDWKLFENNINHSINPVIGDMVIPANGFAVIADNSVDFQNDYPGYSGILLESSFSLSNGGEYLAIKNDSLVIINEVNYVNQSGADNTNFTIEYDSGDWEVSTNYLGTPGDVNSVWEAPNIPMEPDPEDGEIEVDINPTLSAFVYDPENDMLDVEFYNASDDSLIGVDEDVVSQSRAEVNWPNLAYNKTYSWYVIAYDSFYSTQSPTWEFKTLETENNPPNIPSDPNPEDGETDVSVTKTLSWTGGDPDGDFVTYDIYFGTTSPPSEVATDLEVTSYDPGLLDYDTTYYWKIIAYDDKGASTEGTIWDFTTETSIILTIEITKPAENKFYLMNNEFFGLDNRTIVYGGIDINVTVESTNEIDRVEFYVNDKKIGEDDTAPYSINWAPIISFKKTIRVEVFDSEGNNASDEIEVFKWRFHPLLVIAGAAIVLNPNTKLIRTIRGYTIIRGIIFNPKQSGRTLSFRAVNLHYTKVKILSTESGVVRFKKCTIQTALPDTQISLGPLGLFNWIFCKYPGTQLESSGGLFSMNREPMGLLGSLLKS